jgi:hypothetical protein
MKLHRALTSVLALAVVAGLALAQDAPKQAPPKKAPASPPAETSATIGGKKIIIKYSAPSKRGRRIFGSGDALLPDNTIWRAGANQATALHTDGDIMIGNLDVPAGDYTLYVFLDPKGWQLIVSRQTGQWGINRDGSTSLDESKAIGRTPMRMNMQAAMWETYKMTLSGEGKKGMLTLDWAGMSESVDITAK